MFTQLQCVFCTAIPETHILAPVGCFIRKQLLFAISSDHMVRSGIEFYTPFGRS